MTTTFKDLPHRGAYDKLNAPGARAQATAVMQAELLVLADAIEDDDLRPIAREIVTRGRPAFLLFLVRDGTASWPRGDTYYRYCWSFPWRGGRTHSCNIVRRKDGTINREMLALALRNEAAETYKRHRRQTSAQAAAAVVHPIADKWRARGVSIIVSVRAWSPRVEVMIQHGPLSRATIYCDPEKAEAVAEALLEAHARLQAILETDNA